MKECPLCKTCYEDVVESCPSDQSRLVPGLPGPLVIDGKYKLLSCLGKGGMGAVYRATHLHLGRTVAIKTLLQDYANSDATAVSRFNREARAAAAVQHPNVVGVSDFGMTPDNVRYLVMEYVEGRPLNEIIHREAPMQPERVLKIMKQVCAGVGAAHALNLIHRDLKPANIMVTEPLGTNNLENYGLVFAESNPNLGQSGDVPAGELTAKVLDFGLAKILNDEILGDDKTDLKTGIMGTPFYMSPEQCSSKPVDFRSDIYSLGIILYQMLTKEVPFKGDSFGAIVTGHLMNPPPSIRSRNPAVSDALEGVVLRAMSKNPANRQQSAALLGLELDAAVHPVSRSTASSPVFQAADLTPSLTVRTTPGNCEVFVDGDFRGKSNGQGILELRLEPGEYRLKFSAPGWNEHSRTVQMGNSNQSFEVMLSHKTLSGSTSVPAVRMGTGELKPFGPVSPRPPLPPIVSPGEIVYKPEHTPVGLIADLGLAVTAAALFLFILLGFPADPWSVKMEKSIPGMSWWTSAGVLGSALTVIACLVLSDYVFGHKPVPFLAWIFRIARTVFLIGFLGLTVIAFFGAVAGKWDYPTTGWFVARGIAFSVLAFLHHRISARKRAVIV